MKANVLCDHLEEGESGWLWHSRDFEEIFIRVLPHLRARQAEQPNADRAACLAELADLLDRRWYLFDIDEYSRATVAEMLEAVRAAGVAIAEGDNLPGRLAMKDDYRKDLGHIAGYLATLLEKHLARTTDVNGS